jgi:hypothetical protein
MPVCTYLSRIGCTVMPDDSGNERDNINYTIWSFWEDVKLRSVIVKGVRKTAILDTCKRGHAISLSDKKGEKIMNTMVKWKVKSKCRK